MIYGPVPSRRLGISLGMDIIPYKTCSYDCIYCQLGRTTHKTLQRGSYIKRSSFLDEVKKAIRSNGDIDYLTFAGSGEPTLNRDIGWMINEVKKMTRIPVAVLTNGSLLWDKTVREDLRQADLVIPSLDSASEEVFQRVNRPVAGLKTKTVREGLKEFCREFRGRIFLEIMLVKDVNDTPEEIKRINRSVRNLRIDKIQLNTVVRPPADPGAKPLNQRELDEVKELFDPETEKEVIADFKRETSRAYQKDLGPAVIELLKRRPAKAEEMAVSLGVHLNEMVKHLQMLEDEKKIRRTKTEGKSGTYFVIVQ
jgi:wyosine [tRNA(Phe)-imidazoG37] synthetase (radical SAM superfamily)